MNKEEIRHFKSLLRQGSLRHMNILLDDKFQSELLNIIKGYELLEKENEILKENAEHNDKVVDKVNWENQLLKKENKNLKEVIDKAIDKLGRYATELRSNGDAFAVCVDLLDILKGDSNERL